MKALIVTSPYSENFKIKFNTLQDKVYDILPLIVYNKDNVEFLSYLADNFLEGLETYCEENIFICSKCKELAIKGKHCFKEGNCINNHE